MSKTKKELIECVVTKEIIEDQEDINKTVEI